MKAAPYRLAVLYNPKSTHPPSNISTLLKLKTIARNYNIDAQLLTPSDLKLLPLFDGLFIRAETRSHNFAYRWAEMAESLGISVIDTPRGILLACNKELQYELFKKYQIPIPKTQILFEFDDVEKIISQLQFKFPVILKIPEGAWSNGVFKIATKKECSQICKKLLKKNFSTILQEYLYTKFDWRIGIINHEIIYACKYFMVKNHWQIIKRKNGKILDEGDFEAIPIHKIPSEIIAIVKKIILFLDHSLYGIDLKVTKHGVVAIEINDNPNIYNNVEDQYQPEIYQKILETIAKKILIRENKSFKKISLHAPKKQLTEA